jgi:hypothetical protein
MAGYREPGFQDRTAAAAKARSSALERLKAKPPIDPAEQARKIAEAEAREAAKVAKREAAKAAKLAEAEAAAAALKAEAEAAAAAEQAAADALAANVELTEAERKAARDARYAARKLRKGR